MLKYRNQVLTREQLNKAKELHKEAYDAFIRTRKQLMESDYHKGWTDKTRFTLISNELGRPKTMKQCVREVTQAKTEGEQ